MLASYTYARTWGNYPGDIAYDTGQEDPHLSSQYDLIDTGANRAGPLPQDRTHLVKLDAAYTLPLGRATALVGGGRLRVLSGTPVTALGAQFLGSPDEVFVLPRGALGRTPAISELDAHVAVRRRVRDGVTIEAFADVTNLLDEQWAFTLDQSYAPEFVSGAGSQGAAAISGGSYADLIWAKQIDANGDETNRPLARNPHFLQPSAYYAPIAARFGVRLTF